MLYDCFNRLIKEAQQTKHAGWGALAASPKVTRAFNKALDTAGKTNLAPNRMQRLDTLMRGRVQQAGVRPDALVRAMKRPKA